MITLIILAIITVLPIGCGSRDWQEFRSLEGRFSVFFPNPPEGETVKLDTPVGPINQYLFQTEYKDCFLAVAYADFPPTYILVPQNDLLDGARDGTLKKTHGTLLSEVAISLKGYPGREIKVRVASPHGNIIYYSRFYQVKNRQYITIAVMPEGKVLSKTRLKFFNSFRVTGY